MCGAQREEGEGRNAGRFGRWLAVKHEALALGRDTSIVVAGVKEKR